MTNNIELMRNYMIRQGIPMLDKNMGDLFFIVMLVRRGKDHPDLPAANYTFKTYYIDSISKFDYFLDEMIKCCDLFKLRAYISVNIKSKKEYSKMCAFKFTQNILNNEYKKPWRVGDHVFGKIRIKNKNTWLIDLDDINLDNEEDRLYFDQVINIINSCDSNFDPIIIEKVPTRTGYHLLTHPFNIDKFEKKWKTMDLKHDIPGINKNHITLLYENI